jgi:hypothetical protein
MHIFVGLVSLLFIPALFSAFMISGKTFIHSPQILLPFAIGTILGIIIEKTILRRFDRFETFEHELTHVVVALLFFRRIDEFVVTSRGGQVRYGGGCCGEFGSDMIGLSPYFLPTFTLISALVRLFLGNHAFPWFDGWIGFTFGFHLWSTIDEVRTNWTSTPYVDYSGESTRTDIGKRGLIYSTLLITCFGLVTHGVVLALMTKGFPGVLNWGRQVSYFFKAEIAFVLQLIAQVAEKIPLFHN